MPKTVAISDDTHTIITEKKLELFRKYRISIKKREIEDFGRKGCN